MELKIDQSTLDTLISSMNSGINSINPSIPKIHEPTNCSGTVLSDYVKRMNDISKMLTNYKKLLEKDVQDIQKSRDKLKEMDTKMSDIFKAVLNAAGGLSGGGGGGGSSGGGGASGSF